MTDNQNNQNQDAYTWQNPNPYNGGYDGYTGYQGTPKKPKKPKRERKKLSATEIALICVSSFTILLIVAVGMLAPMVIKNNMINPEDEGQTQTEQDSDKQNNNVPQLETQKPTNGALSIPEVYNKVKDSVVGIVVTAATNGTVSQGSGTGIILSEDGYISTNAHVVNGATKIKVVLTDKSEHEAELVGIDTRTDLAVVKINKSGLKAAEIGDSDDLVVGQTVIAIGNPYGLELAGTVTSGIVSALNRQIVIESFYMTLIQTDASINPGNSGGPLVNEFGQVIGITSSKIVSSGYEGIGFAIPITSATEIVRELIQHGYIKDRPFIGIQGSDIDPSYASIYSLPQGVYVEYVDPESDAYKKGLKRGDIIVAVDGVQISSMAQLDSEKNKKSPGDTLKLTVYRNTRKIDISIVLSEATNEN